MEVDHVYLNTRSKKKPVFYELRNKQKKKRKQKIEKKSKNKYIDLFLIFTVVFFDHFMNNSIYRVLFLYFLYHFYHYF
jgi:hypothetical protein